MKILKRMHFFPHLEDISARYLHFHSSAANLRALVVPFPLATGPLHCLPSAGPALT